MSNLILPSDTSVMVTVLQPAKTLPGIGMVNFLTRSMVGAQSIIAGIVHHRAMLEAGLPPIVEASVPVAIVVHVIFPGGGTFASGFSMPIDLPAPRETVVDAIRGVMPEIVGAAFQNIQNIFARAGVAPPIADTPVGNAPTTDTKQ